METTNVGQSPFQDIIDPEKFFPGARRREVLEEVKVAINESVALLTLTGDEGCGKSMLCRMIEKETPACCIPVLFSQTLESFEDVSRAIAQKMKITLADGVNVGDIRDLLLEVWERLAEKNQRMLIIFDQSERIYLATLERIRKMLDMMNQTGIAFQILFSGRPEVLDNLRQLTMCSFQGAEERHFALEPMDSSATYAYLNFRMNGGKAGEDEKFSMEASEEVFLLSGGNFRRTNMIAEKVLGHVGDVTPPPSEPLPEPDLAGRPKSAIVARWQAWYPTYRKWILPAAACLSLLIVLLIIGKGRSPEMHEKKPVPELDKLSAEIRDIQKKAEEIKAQANQTVPEPPSEIRQEEPRKEEAVHPPVTPIPMTEGSQQAAVPKDAVPAKQDERVSSAGKPQPQPSGPEKIPVEKLTVDQVFNARIAAAAKWLVGEKNDHYTIQLMVLASENAENNIKKMLGQKEYRDVAHQLFFLRKVAATPTILVFYGEYPTMVEARNTRNALPEFLLKHNPYAISVRGAVEKANGG